MAVKKKKSKSRVNEAGNYTKPAMRKRLFSRIKAGLIKKLVVGINHEFKKVTKVIKVLD